MPQGGKLPRSGCTKCSVGFILEAFAKAVEGVVGSSKNVRLKRKLAAAIVVPVPTFFRWLFRRGHSSILASLPT